VVQGDRSDDPPTDASCLYSRLPVRIRPEWTDVLLSGDHRFNLRLIGRQIISTRPTGSVDEQSTLATLDRVGEAVDTFVPAGLPFIWIADYTDMAGITMRARRLFASRISQWPRLAGMVLFGLSPFFSATIRLGIRLKLVSFPVRTAASYQEAVEAATTMLSTPRLSERPASDGPTVLTDEQWELELGGYSIRYEVIDKTILHSVQKGRVKEEHLDPVFELRDEVLRSSGLKGRAFSILAGLDRVERSDHGARLGYLRRMKRWHRENPFDIEVFYGVNPLMQSVINVSSHLAPFKVHVSKTYQEGLDYITDFVSTGGMRENVGDPGQPKSFHNGDGVPEERIDELLKALGGISWGSDDDLSLHEADPSDPLAPVYEAISLIKTEIDDLLVQHERDAVERRRLQERLARSEKMEALGLLAGGVAHDLNNILSGIVTYPDLLLMDETLSPKTRRAVETIKKSGEQAAAVVNDMMPIARGAATRNEPVSLGAIVKEYLTSLDFRTLRSKSRGIAVRSRLDDEGALVSGSPAHLRKAVSNLVINALESFDNLSREGRVDVETSLQRIESSRSAGPEGVQDGDYVLLRVRDSGQGIDAEHQKRIFEPFFSKKVMGRSGTGLGLTVVWNIVQHQDGFIDLESGERGTVFDLYFPVTAERPLEVDEAIPLERLCGAGERVLVVDDVVEQRKIASALLERLGYQVESVSSGEAAIDRLRQESWDLLLLDMLMEPGINGRQTYEKILEIHPGQKAVIASGYSEDDEVRKARALGAGAFIAKPYSLEKVGVAVRDVLRN
jgi:signal transduction histidine kinase